MSEAKPPTRQFSLVRRLFWVIGVFFLVILIVSLGIYGYRESRTGGDLAAIIDKLDETDPGWRLDDIEAARIRLEDKDNSAVLCRELVKMLGPKWPDYDFLDRFLDRPIGELLDAEREALLDAEMKRLEPARLIARRMVTLPKGRHRLEHKFNPLVTLLPDQQDTRKVGALFGFEMRYQANKGNVSEAVRAGRACVCAGRSLYDEPMKISALVRIAIIAIAASGVERSLALGESNDAELAALDALLAEEEQHNTYLCCLRGERTTLYLLHSRMISGEHPTTDIMGELHKEDRSRFDKLFTNERQILLRQFPRVMLTLNCAVEIGQMPSHEQAAAEKLLEDELEKKRELIALFFVSIRRVGELCRRKTAEVATLRGLIAVERYRMKHKKWPAKLGDVVPEFLKSIPTDPFDGKPLRMVRVPDGVIVYSVGIDGVDDGGKLNRDGPRFAENVDRGYQLWDVAKRRRPASPPKPKPMPEEDDP